MEEQEKTKKVKPIAKSVAPVPEDAVGQVTVETTQPGGEQTVQTVPASEVKSAPRATRQTRDQRKRSREASRTKRAAAPPPAPRDNTAVERTIAVSLPAHQWERWDKLMARNRQDASVLLRRLLGPYLR